MLSPTPRLALRILLPASYLVFLAGAMVSGAIFFHGRAFDVKEAIVSDLQSPDDNPHGYAALATCIVASSMLLSPAAAVFYRQLREERPRLALAGAFLFVAGLSAAVAVGALAPFTHGYSFLHDQLAAAAFIGICAGTWLDLLAARAAPALLVTQCAVLPVLVFVSYGPVEFDNSHLLTGIAFWEWGLCAYCGVMLWALAWVIEVKAAKVGSGQKIREG
jgi:hypothetical protein